MTRLASSAIAGRSDHLPELPDSFRRLAGLLAVISLAACAGLSRPPPAQTPDRTPDRLAAAAERAAAASAELAAIEAHRNPVVVPSRPPAQVPAELARPLDLSWIGPAADITRYLAGRAGWPFAATGLEPVRPVIVSIDSTGRRLIDLLWDIGQQAGVRALVEIDIDARRIALIYPGARE